MVRYLDFNDMYFSPVGGGGHPSDLIPTALAMGQALHCGGRDVLHAIVIGYEVLGALAGTVRIRERGWDQGLNAVVAAAMIAGKLHGLSKEQLGHAVALAVVPHVPTRQTRVGELSMWKGAATAGAARNGMFAALLASKGMTGPPGAFDGFDGIKQLVTGPFDLTLPALPDSYVIERIHTKYRPAEYNAQGALDVILRLRDNFALDAIERIDVETYWLAYSEIGMEPAKWDPRTRETADHSIPYLLAVALVDGAIDLRSYTPERVLDPALRPIMRKITVRENKDYSRRFPAELLVKITITAKGGKTITEELAYPRGHTRNPVTDAELDQKFDALVDTRGPRDAAVCRELRKTLWAFDAVRDVSTALEPLAGLRAL
jgi:2-methylcitrate dehydratase